MKKIVQDIVLDFNTVSAFWFVHAKQGDKNSRVIRITLNDNGVTYRPDASINAKIRVQKPDGKMVISDCSIDENGRVIAELTDQMLAVCGDVEADVYLTDGNGYILSTCNFVICVDNPPDGASAVSENEFLTLMNAVERAESAAKRAEDAAGSGGGSGNVNAETVKQAVDDYLSENPPSGVPGKDGVGVRSITGNADGSWTITYTDNNTEIVSNEAYTSLKTLIDGKQPVGDYLADAHNTSQDAHNDIRNLITGLTSRLNALLDSDDTSLDQLSEIVAYIKSNKSLIEQVTTNKVNVSDIVNNLTTNDTNKPLSASMGVELKKLIDAINVPTSLSQLTQDSEHRTVTDAEKAKWNSGTGDGTPGENGGYYTPAVTQPDVDHMQVAFSASKTGMPEVEPVSVALPKGTGGGTAVSLEKLTITGAVNAEYDGTKPVTVDIPASEGGEGGGGTAPTKWVKIAHLDVTEETTSALKFEFDASKYPGLSDNNVIYIIIKNPTFADKMPWVQTKVNNLVAAQYKAGSAMISSVVRVSGGYARCGMLDGVNPSLYATLTPGTVGASAPFYGFGIPWGVETGSINKVTLESHTSFIKPGGTIDIWGWNE